MKLKIITLNVWHGGRLWDEMIEFLKAEDADVLLMQEFHVQKDEAIEPRLRTREEFRELFEYADDDFSPAFDWLQGKTNVTQGNAILSKFPISKRYEPVFFNEPFNPHYEDKPETYPHAPRNLQHVTLDVQGTPLDVCNFQGVWDLDGTNDSPQRLNMSEVIVEAVQGLPNVILGGDTNAQRNCQTIRNIEQHLINVFKDELPTSFNVQQKDLEKFPGYATAVVDMLFVSPSLTIVEKYCPQVNVSDHLPLVMVVEMPTA